MLPALGEDLLFSLDPFLRCPHKPTQKRVSWLIPDPIKLSTKTNHHTYQRALQGTWFFFGDSSPFLCCFYCHFEIHKFLAWFSHCGSYCNWSTVWPCGLVWCFIKHAFEDNQTLFSTSPCAGSYRVSTHHTCFQITNWFSTVAAGLECRAQPLSVSRLKRKS